MTRLLSIFLFALATRPALGGLPDNQPATVTSTEPSTEPVTTSAQGNDPEEAVTGPTPREDMREMVVNTLAHGLPCSVKALSTLSRWNTSCKADNQQTAANRRQKRDTGVWYCKRKYCCPDAQPADATQDLGTDPTNYPIGLISDFMVIARQPAGSERLMFENLLPQVVMPEQTPVFFDARLSERDCPSEQEQLWSYRSPFLNINCWVIQNLQPPIMVNLNCGQTLCGCRRPSVTGWFYYQRTLHAKLCYPEFQVVEVVGFCPDFDANPVFDVLLVPQACTCRSVQCTRQYRGSTC